jgi:hypothetical protein
VIKRRKLSIPQVDIIFKYSSAFLAATLQASSSVLPFPNTTHSRLVGMDRRTTFSSEESREVDGHTTEKLC